MSYWPSGMKVGPIGKWPGVMTQTRTRSNFSASMGATLQTLNRELWYLGEKNTELLIAIEPNAFRLDGYPRSTAKATHPGIILSLDSRFGHLSYPCDTFDRWEDNLRAIALALEALRKVDRYGVTKRGEQYRGFLAIEGGTALPAPITTADQAIGVLLKFSEYTAVPPDAAGIRRVLRLAQRATHTDEGGNAADFQRVTDAENFLRKNGALA